MRFSNAAVTLGVLLTAGMAVGVSAQTDPLIGTWNLNVAKSTYSPGPPPQSQTRTAVAQGDGVRVTFVRVDAAGVRTTSTYETKYDGKVSRYSTGGGPNGADSIAVKRTDSNTTEITSTKAGKVVATTTAVVSKDGKTLTQRSKGVNEKGGCPGAC